MANDPSPQLGSWQARNLSPIASTRRQQAKTSPKADRNSAEVDCVFRSVADN